MDANVGASVVRVIAWCRVRLTLDEQRAVHLALADACAQGQPQDGCLCHEAGWKAHEESAIGIPGGGQIQRHPEVLIQMQAVAAAPEIEED